MGPDLSPGEVNNPLISNCCPSADEGLYVARLAGNKRQKITEPESARPESDDTEMQGSHTNAPCCRHITLDTGNKLASADAVPVVKAAADPASDCNTWSVQQLMKLYYGMALMRCAQKIMHSSLNCCLLACRPIVSTPGYVQMVGIWQW